MTYVVLQDIVRYRRLVHARILVGLEMYKRLFGDVFVQGSLYNSKDVSIETDSIAHERIYRFPLYVGPF